MEKLGSNPSVESALDNFRAANILAARFALASTKRSMELESDPVYQGLLNQIDDCAADLRLARAIESGQTEHPTQQLPAVELAK